MVKFSCCSSCIANTYIAVSYTHLCSVESKEQITYVAQRVQAAGASILRGGAFKPRTSPYSFQLSLIHICFT